MEQWKLSALLCILAGAGCLGETYNATCVYDPCQNGGTCMNVYRPVDGDFVEYEGVYYLYVFSNSMTWAEANDYCKKEGGGLVGFEDKAEEKFDDGKNFLQQESAYWVSARYHGSSSEWKWYPSNETFMTDLQGEDGDCMIYVKGLSVSKPQVKPCNDTYNFICEGYNAWTSQCRCPAGYFGAFCEESAESSTTDDPAVYNSPYPFARTKPPTMYCKERVYENITYVVTPENTTIHTPCPRGYTGQVTFSCLVGGMWQDSGPDNSRCTKITEASKLDQEIMAGNKEAVEIAETLEGLVTGSTEQTDLEDEEVVDLLTNLNTLQAKQLQDTNKTKQERIDTVSLFAERAVSISSTILISDSEKEEDPEKSVAVDLTKVVEEVAFIVANELDDDTSKTISTESIDMTSGNLPGGRQQSLQYPQDHIFDMNNTGAAATMPLSAFGDDPTKTTTLAFLEYKKIANIGNKTFQSEYTSDEVINKSVVNSIVFGVSASHGDAPVTTFAPGDRVIFTLNHQNSNLTGTASCIFLDLTDNETSGSWSTRGCEVVASNRTHTTCACNHLTNFAILLDVTGVYEEISDAHITALEMLTIIGCSVSIGCLAICIFAFSFFKSLWNTRTTIHRNLCISLLTAQLLFLVGVERTENEIVCTVIAAILHYTFLCAFAWMALEGIQLYIMLVHVFSTSSKVLPYYLAGYGLPAVVVAVAGGISKGEGYGQEKYCWLSTERGFIWSFAGPVALVILVNFVFLVVSIRIAYSGRAAVSKDATNAQNIKVWIKGAVTLTFLLGSTWGVGFFFLSGSSIPLAYAFTILNTLQGMFIFIYHCLGNERIKKEMAKFLLRQPCLPACLRARLEVIARAGSSVYSTTQSSTAPPPKKSDTVALAEKKKDAVHPVVYVQDVDVDDGKPKSWLYNRSGAEETKVIHAADYPEPEYF